MGMLATRNRMYSALSEQIFGAMLLKTECNEEEQRRKRLVYRHRK
jgi:hypothetical protein